MPEDLIHRIHTNLLPTAQLQSGGPVFYDTLLIECPPAAWAIGHTASGKEKAEDRGGYFPLNHTRGENEDLKAGAYRETTQLGAK